MTFTFGTLCSGIESASEAFNPLGAECRYVSEIEPYPCGVLADLHSAGKPMRMPSPDDVEFPGGLDPNDAELFKVLAAKTKPKPAEAAFVKAWRTRAERRAAIKTIDRFDRWGDRIPNFGDLTQIDPDEIPAVDLLVAGFPCQDYSIAGLRQSLAGARGNLTLLGVMLIHELRRRGRIRSVLLEQVPDILNTKDNAFGSLLGGIVGHDAAIASPLKGGRWPSTGVADGPLGRAAWRVEDAQYSGLAQRRERLFFAGDFGNGPDPVEVLLEREGLSRNPPARRKAGQGIARPLAAGSASSGGYRNDADTAENLVPTSDIAPTLRAQEQPSHRADSEAYVAVRQTAFGGNNTAGPLDVATARTASHTASGRQDFESETFIVQAPDVATTLRARDSARGADSDCTDTLIVPVTYSIMPQNSGKDYKARAVDVAQPLMAAGPVGGNQGGDYVVQPVAFNWRGGGTQTSLGFDPDAGTVGALHVGQTPAIAFTCKDYGGDAGDLSPTLRSMGHADSHQNGGGQVAVAFAIQERAVSENPDAGPDGIGVKEDLAYTLEARTNAQAVAFSLRGRDGGAMPEVEQDGLSPGLRAADGGSTRPFVACATGDITHTLTAEGFDASEDGTGRGPPLAAGMAVRRITVVEAERLQGFRDHYTLIEWPTANRKGQDLEETIAYLIGHGFTPERAAVLAQTPDGPRYKAIGNSKPVFTLRKIGRAYAMALERHLASEAA